MIYEWDGRLNSIKISHPLLGIVKSNQEVGDPMCIGDVNDEKKVRRPVFPIISHRQICFLPPLPSAPSLFFSISLLFDPTSSLGRKTLKRPLDLIRPQSASPPLLGTLDHSRVPFPYNLLPSSVTQTRFSHDGGVIHPTVSRESSPQWYVCSLSHALFNPAALDFSTRTSITQPRLRRSPWPTFLQASVLYHEALACDLILAVASFDENRSCETCDSNGEQHPRTISKNTSAPMDLARSPRSS